MLKDRLEQDIKTALLSGDKQRAEVLKSLKSAVLYEEVAKKVRDTGLDETSILSVFAREAKKRGESAELYKNAGEDDRATTELSEKAIIDEYLPKQMNDEELTDIARQVIDGMGDEVQMGQAIGAVKAKVGQAADGGRIAKIVKDILS